MGPDRPGRGHVGTLAWLVKGLGGRKFLTHEFRDRGRGFNVLSVRRDTNDHLKKILKAHEVSEDDEKHAVAEVQKLTDQHIEHINEILKKKEAEILEV
jgi:ribosome recycling factor